MKPLRTVCKKIDDVSSNDIGIIRNNIVVNLFSNLLDIDDYSTPHLISLMNRIKKQKTIMSVYPHISMT